MDPRIHTSLVQTKNCRLLPGPPDYVQNIKIYVVLDPGWWYHMYKHTIRYWEISMEILR